MNLEIEVGKIDNLMCPWCYVDLEYTGCGVLREKEIVYTINSYQCPECKTQWAQYIKERGEH